MILSNLLDALDIDAEVLGRRDVEITGLATDSRRVGGGDLFFALVGRRQDAHGHVPEALARGAAAIVVERPDSSWAGATVVVTAHVRRALGLAAARFHGEPSRGLVAVGVTGTNGKTTTTYLLEAIWRAAGLEPGVIGTVSYRWRGRVEPAPFTTPEAPELQAGLARMAAAGVHAVAVEVSSHALALDRVRGCHWDAVVFTNLSHDHLDFHGDLEQYYRTKASLFLDHLSASAKVDPIAVINADDPYGARLARVVTHRLVTFGRDRAATVHPLETEETIEGIRGILSVSGARVRVESPLIGGAHLENLMAAAGTAYGLGLPPGAVEEGIRACALVPGRFERIPTGDGRVVLVDYAHTPDALERALRALRAIGRRRIVTVFGCGGDRDRAKRPVMGGIAGRLSDAVVLTSDNPRTEDPCRIIADIEAGLGGSGLARIDAEELAAGAPGYVLEPDRRDAIALALRAARAGDVVLIAGKGHEDYQMVGTERRPLDDRVEVRRLIGGGPQGAD